MAGQETTGLGDVCYYRRTLEAHASKNHLASREETLAELREDLTPGTWRSRNRRLVHENHAFVSHKPSGKSKQAPVLVPFGWNCCQALDIARHGGPGGMPAFTESELSDEELKHIVHYLKTLN